MDGIEGWENILGHRYPPVGKCIYCGSDGGAKGLSDEHMVPFSLGGDAVLPKASCAACATETSKIELYLARHIFHGLRSHVGAPSRKKSLPSTLSASISVGDHEGSYEFLAADQPFALMLPTWDYPGIMRQVQPTEDFPVCNIRAYNFVPNLRDLLGLADDAPDPLVHIAPGTLNNILFARFQALGPSRSDPRSISLCPLFCRHRSSRAAAECQRHPPCCSNRHRQRPRRTECRATIKVRAPDNQDERAFRGLC